VRLVLQKAPAKTIQVIDVLRKASEMRKPVVCLPVVGQVVLIKSKGHESLSCRISEVNEDFVRVVDEQRRVFRVDTKALVVAKSEPTSQHRLILKSKLVRVPASAKHKAYVRNDPRTKKAKTGLLRVREILTDDSSSDELVRRALLFSWRKGTGTVGAILLQEAVKDELLRGRGTVYYTPGSYSPVFDPSDEEKPYVVSSVMREKIRKVVRGQYRETQKQLKAQRGEWPIYTLYRGVVEEGSLGNALTSWSDSREVADSFAGAVPVIRQYVPAQRIFASVGTEGEYLVLPAEGTEKSFEKSEYQERVGKECVQACLDTPYTPSQKMDRLKAEFLKEAQAKQRKIREEDEWAEGIEQGKKWSVVPSDSADAAVMGLVERNSYPRVMNPEKRVFRVDTKALCVAKSGLAAQHKLILKAKRVYVAPSLEHRGYFRMDPRTKKEVAGPTKIEEPKPEVSEEKPSTSALHGQEIVDVVSVVDTRDWVEGDDDKFHPVPGSGTENTCARCGKPHEIHATVKMADGSQAVVGVSCARKESIEKEIKAKLAAAQTGKRLEAELKRAQEKLVQAETAEKKANALPLPPLELTEIDLQGGEKMPVLRMGDAEVWLSYPWKQGDPISEERKKAVEYSWRDKRYKESGLPLSAYSYYQRVKELEKYLARYKKRVELAAAGEFGKVEKSRHSLVLHPQSLQKSREGLVEKKVPVKLKSGKTVYAIRYVRQDLGPTWLRRREKQSWIKESDPDKETISLADRMVATPEFSPLKEYFTKQEYPGLAFDLVGGDAEKTRQSITTAKEYPAEVAAYVGNSLDFCWRMWERTHKEDAKLEAAKLLRPKEFGKNFPTFTTWAAKHYEDKDLTAESILTAMRDAIHRNSKKYTIPEESLLAFVQELGLREESRDSFTQGALDEAFKQKKLSPKQLSKKFPRLGAFKWSRKITVREARKMDLAFEELELVAPGALKALGPKLTIKPRRLGYRAFGGLFHPNLNGTGEIEIDIRYRESFAHEMGHALEYLVQRANLEPGVPTEQASRWVGGGAFFTRTYVGRKIWNELVEKGTIKRFEGLKSGIRADYYASPVEVFARIFEQYTAGRLGKDHPNRVTFSTPTAFSLQYSNAYLNEKEAQDILPQFGEAVRTVFGETILKAITRRFRFILKSRRLLLLQKGKSFPTGTIRYWKGQAFKKLPTGEWVPYNLTYGRKATEEEVDKVTSGGKGHNDLEKRPDENPPDVEESSKETPKEEKPVVESTAPLKEPTAKENPDGTKVEESTYSGELDPKALLEKEPGLKEFFQKSSEPTALLDAVAIPAFGVGKREYRKEAAIIHPLLAQRLRSDYALAFRLWKLADTEGRSNVPDFEEIEKKYPKLAEAAGKYATRSVETKRHFTGAVSGMRKYVDRLLQSSMKSGDTRAFDILSKTIASWEISQGSRYRYNVVMNPGYADELARRWVERQREGTAKKISTGEFKNLKGIKLTGKGLTKAQVGILDQSVGEVLERVPTAKDLAERTGLSIKVTTIPSNKASGVYVPAKNYIELDFRSPNALAHEWCHFFDHQLGVSLSPAWKEGVEKAKEIGCYSRWLSLGYVSPPSSENESKAQALIAKMAKNFLVKGEHPPNYYDVVAGLSLAREGEAYWKYLKTRYMDIGGLTEAEMREIRDLQGTSIVKDRVLYSDMVKKHAKKAGSYGSYLCESGEMLSRLFEQHVATRSKDKLLVSAHAEKYYQTRNGYFTEEEYKTLLPYMERAFEEKGGKGFLKSVMRRMLYIQKSHEGLTRKKVTVHGKGKTFQADRWVRTGEEEAEPTATSPKTTVEGVHVEYDHGAGKEESAKSVKLAAAGLRETLGVFKGLGKKMKSFGATVRVGKISGLGAANALYQATDKVLLLDDERGKDSLVHETGHLMDQMFQVTGRILPKESYDRIEKIIQERRSSQHRYISNVLFRASIAGDKEEIEEALRGSMLDLIPAVKEELTQLLTPKPSVAWTALYSYEQTTSMALKVPTLEEAGDPGIQYTSYINREPEVWARMLNQYFAYRYSKTKGSEKPTSSDSYQQMIDAKSHSDVRFASEAEKVGFKYAPRHFMDDKEFQKAVPLIEACLKGTGFIKSILRVLELLGQGERT